VEPVRPPYARAHGDLSTNAPTTNPMRPKPAERTAWATPPATPEDMPRWPCPAVVCGSGQSGAATPHDPRAAAAVSGAPYPRSARGWVAALRLTTPRRRLSTVAERCPATGGNRVGTTRGSHLPPDLRLCISEWEQWERTSNPARRDDSFYGCTEVRGGWFPLFPRSASYPQVNTGVGTARGSHWVPTNRKGRPEHQGARPVVRSITACRPSWRRTRVRRHSLARGVGRDGTARSNDPSGRSATARTAGALASRCGWSGGPHRSRPCA